MTGSTLLLLADGRFPCGGHAHSGGLEEAIVAGRVQGRDELYSFLVGRLSTVGLVDSTLAASACSVGDDNASLQAADAEAAARCASPALRASSRAQGRGMLRAAKEIWGGPAWMATHEMTGFMYPVALGAAGYRAGLSPAEVALVAAQGAVTGPAWAATRLLGMSPFEVASCLAQLADEVSSTAGEAWGLVRQQSGHGQLRGLPALSSPLLELGAERHARREVRFFAS
ncbi:MAG TPA: urease accessory UreF family protein [Acidimicrobiales bacterium]|nr:urease accessory UreF family protein [Acidimicrobiales bacterium]